ncbi:MAG TPA: F0F1 ATP synthase subunit delta, partial [Caldithrix sp.]|nr:F0F1 ATP synthase subunit delta [Caldithrix sp.]
MVGTRVTIRYARALFELAQEKKVLSQVADDLNYILR